MLHGDLLEQSWTLTWRSRGMSLSAFQANRSVHLIWWHPVRCLAASATQPDHMLVQKSLTATATHTLFFTPYYNTGKHHCTVDRSFPAMAAISCSGHLLQHPSAIWASSLQVAASSQPSRQLPCSLDPIISAASPWIPATPRLPRAVSRPRPFTQRAHHHPSRPADSIGKRHHRP